MFEKCQNAQAADLFPPLCVVFFCRASARLQKSALIGEKISRLWAFRHLSNKAWLPYKKFFLILFLSRKRMDTTHFCKGEHDMKKFWKVLGLGALAAGLTKYYHQRPQPGGGRKAPDRHQSGRGHADQQADERHGQEGGAPSVQR